MQLRDAVVLFVLVRLLVAVGAQYVQGQYPQKACPSSTFFFKPPENQLASRPEARALGGHVFGDLFQIWRQTRQPSPCVADDPYFVSDYSPCVHLLLKQLSLRLPQRPAPSGSPLLAVLGPFESVAA